MITINDAILMNEAFRLEWERASEEERAELEARYGEQIGVYLSVDPDSIERLKKSAAEMQANWRDWKNTPDVLPHVPEEHIVSSGGMSSATHDFLVVSIIPLVLGIGVGFSLAVLLFVALY